MPLSETDRLKTAAIRFVDAERALRRLDEQRNYPMTDAAAKERLDMRAERLLDVRRRESELKQACRVFVGAG